MQNRDTKFIQRLNTISSLNYAANLLDEFPEREEEIYQFIVEPENFERLVTLPVHFANLLNDFPNHREALYEILIKPENFRRLTLNETHLSYLATQFPSHKDVLQDQKLKDEITYRNQKFIRKLETIWSGFWFSNIISLIKEFPEFNEQIYQFIMEPKNFKRLMDSSHYLEYLLSTFKHHKNDIYEHLLLNPEIFQQLAKNPDELESLLKQLFGHAKDKYKIIVEPRNFQHFASSDYSLRCMATLFPTNTLYEKHREPPFNQSELAQEYPEDEVFQQENMATALNFLACSKEQVAYTKGAIAGFFGNKAFTKNIDKEVYGLIGGLFDRKTGGRVAQTCKAAARNAEEEKNKFQLR